jgi:Arc/MetJ-type ribon-helix-helix transcriptional regulator
VVVQRYDCGMTAKIAVSLPDHLVAEARAAVVDGRAPSVSAYVAEALAEKSKRRTLSEVLDEMDVELGSPDAAAMDRAARVLDAHR